MSDLDPADTYDEIPVDDDAEPDDADAPHDGEHAAGLAESEREGDA